MKLPRPLSPLVLCPWSLVLLLTLVLGPWSLVLSRAQPANVQADPTTGALFRPALGGNLVSTSATQTLTNKTLTAPILGNATATSLTGVGNASLTLSGGGTSPTALVLAPGGTTTATTLDLVGSLVVTQSTFTPSTEFVEFRPTLSTIPGDNIYGVRTDFNWAGSGAGGSSTHGGASVLGRMVITGANNTTITGRVSGVRGGAEHAGSGAANDLRAGDFSATITGTGSSSSLTGVYTLLGIDAAANGGTVAEARGFYLPTVDNLGSGTTITALNGIQIAAQTAGITNRAILTEGSTVSSFGGRVLIGQNIDSANGLLQIPGSTSTTGLALGIRAKEVIYRSAVDQLTVGGALLVSDVLTAGDDIIPDATASYDIGKTGNRFRQGWFSSSITTSTSLTAGTAITAGTTITASTGFYVPPQSAPSSPASGWVIYTDEADSNKLKAKASTGTVVTLGTP